MLRSPLKLIVLVLNLCIATAAHAQSVALVPPAYPSSYDVIRTWKDHAMRLSSADEAETWRRAVRAKYGQQGLDRLFSNFEGRGSIGFGIPGIRENLNLTLSDNKAVAKGARRTHLYVTRIYNNPDLTLLSVNESTTTPYGRTDKDIVFRHKASGQRIRCEVKEAKPESQRADIKRLKSQIDKIAFESRRTGEIGAIVNRKKVLPEIDEYARKRGVRVYENVATGREATRSGMQSIDKVLTDLSRHAEAATRNRIVSGAGRAGFGVLLVYDAVFDVTSLYEKWHLQGAYSRGDWIRVGQTVALGISGTGLMLSGSSSLAQHIVGNQNTAQRLGSFGRAGGGVALAAFLIAEGFIITEWMSGEINTRQFVIVQVSMGGGLVGALTGAWAGSKTGTLAGAWFGPWGPPIGATLGSLVGAYLGARGGSRAAQTVADKYYGFKDAKHEKAVRDYVYGYYASDLQDES